MKNKKNTMVDDIDELLKGMRQRLVDLRNLKHLSQDDVGSNIDVSGQLVSKYEVGEVYCPPLKRLIGYSRYFGVSLDYLVFGESNASTSASSRKELLYRMIQDTSEDMDEYLCDIIQLHYEKYLSPKKRRSQSA